MYGNMIKVAGIKNESMVDGPGIRFALFVQGCPRSCPGCQNPDSQDPQGGVYMTIPEILEYLDALPSIDGVTFSGGEPFMQPSPMAELGRKIKERGYHLITYTGYTFEELLKESESCTPIHELLRVTDVLVDGPYRQEEQQIGLDYKGSKNQRLIEVGISLKQTRPIEWSGEW